MADLSQLSDEQLEVYRDLLVKKGQGNSSGAGEGVTGQKGTPLEEAISPTGGPDNFLTSPHGFIRSGARQVVHGIGEVLKPGQRMQGASDILRGTGSVVTPVAIPLAVANPVTAAIGMGTGMAGGKLAHAGLEAAGASEGAQNLGEDVARLATGGIAGGMAHPRLSPAVQAGMKVAAPGVAGGGAMIAAGEGLAKVPGMEWPARIGLGYPGARQIGNSLKSGFEAGKENFRQSRPIPPSPGASDKWSGPSSPGQAPGPVGPIGKPTLPSGRKVGTMPAETPVAPSPNAPGNSPAPNPQAPPTSNIQGANSHPPGTTPADEFLPPKGVAPVVPPSGLQPQGGAISPQGPPTPHPANVIKPGSGAPGDVNGPARVKSPSEIKHEAYTDRKHENIKNYVQDEKNGITPEFLKKLRDDITQVDDPQLQAHAIQIAKGLGADVGRHAVKNGNPASKYGTFNLQDINIALKHLKK